MGDVQKTASTRTSTILPTPSVFRTSIDAVFQLSRMAGTPMKAQQRNPNLYSTVKLDLTVISLLYPSAVIQTYHQNPPKRLPTAFYLNLPAFLPLPFSFTPFTFGEKPEILLIVLSLSSSP
jgi:hypothetical protein